MGQLTGGIAHDFNNLLTVVLANAELIASTPPGRSSEVRGILSELMEATRSGATLIRQLLGFSRRAELRPLALDLNDTIRLTNGMLRRVLPESITITERLTAVPPVSADKAALQQIFLNLATNARDAMPSGGTFTLETGVVDIGEDYVVTHPWVTTGTYVCVSCSDSGHGMDPATVERVFDPFFTTKDPGRGTGLGMPMVYGLMKQHGGFVHVYSELGHGTTVKLYFPISAASTGGPSSVSEPTDDVPRGRGETILVVEDQEALRRTIVRVLTKLGYRVLEANGTNAGLRMYDEHRHEVALVLSDLVMAGPSGRMLYERLKAEKPAPKFILTSGYTAGDIEERAKIGTDVPFLAKPWSVAEVAQLVRRVLDDS
jgi:CheY-like chemotaxis protein